MDDSNTTSDTPWIGARVFGRFCAQEGLPRVAPKDLDPEAAEVFLEAYDREAAQNV
jgi:hypothetical protein